MRVLVVEDEVRLAAALQRGLVADGFDVDVVHDGAAAVARVREDHYDAVVLDIMLPVLNGYRVCARLRSDGYDVPILMLTAKSGEYDEAEGLETGADDYLRKPFSFVVLTARLRALARRHGRGTRDAARVGPLELDPLTRSATVDGAPLGLTPREFRLLEVLAEAAGRTLTRSALLDRVWGPTFDGTDNVVEVYVSYLRRKLRRVGGQDDLVETVRGRGYRLRLPGPAPDGNEPAQLGAGDRRVPTGGLS